MLLDETTRVNDTLRVETPLNSLVFMGSVDKLKNCELTLTLRTKEKSTRIAVDSKLITLGQITSLDEGYVTDFKGQQIVRVELCPDGDLNLGGSTYLDIRFKNAEGSTDTMQIFALQSHRFSDKVNTYQTEFVTGMQKNVKASTSGARLFGFAPGGVDAITFKLQNGKDIDIEKDLIQAFSFLTGDFSDIVITETSQIMENKMAVFPLHFGDVGVREIRVSTGKSTELYTQKVVNY